MYGTTEATEAERQKEELITQELAKELSFTQTKYKSTWTNYTCTQRLYGHNLGEGLRLHSLFSAECVPP